MLSAIEASELREFVEARRYAFALEALSGILLDENKHVTPELYSRIHSLIELTDGVDPFVIDSLRAAVRYDYSGPRDEGPNVTVGGMVNMRPSSRRTICQLPSCTIQ